MRYYTADLRRKGFALRFWVAPSLSSWSPPDLLPRRAPEGAIGGQACGRGVGLLRVEADRQSEADDCYPEHVGGPFLVQTRLDSMTDGGRPTQANYRINA